MRIRVASPKRIVICMLAVGALLVSACSTLDRKALFRRSCGVKRPFLAFPTLGFSLINPPHAGRTRAGAHSRGEIRACEAR